MIRTHYVVLGVPPGAKFRDIRSRYLDLALKHHPDLNPKDAELFKEITAAFGELKEPSSRYAYDMALKLRIKRCKACDGKGEEVVLKTGAQPVTKLCRKCKGTGQDD